MLSKINHGHSEGLTTVSPLGIDALSREVYEEVSMFSASLNVESGETWVSTNEFSFLTKSAVTGVVLDGPSLRGPKLEWANPD